MQIAEKSNTAKIISGILATISIVVIARIFVPAIWFWIGFEVSAALFVAIGCAGEWYLHHHPSGRKRVEKEEHHKLESRFIAAVAVGVLMEFFSLGHAIPEAIKLEKEAADAQVQVKQLGVQIIDTSNIVAQANERIAVANANAAQAEAEAAQANERAAKFDADRVLVEKEAEEIRSNNFELQAKVLELESKTQQRSISPEKKAELVTSLSFCPKGTVFVLANILDPEATQYAKDFEEVLKKSDFDVKRPTSWSDPHSIFSSSDLGIVLVMKDLHKPPKIAVPMQRAFMAAGITMGAEYSGDPNCESNKVEIVIGNRF